MLQLTTICHTVLNCLYVYSASWKKIWNKSMAHFSIHLLFEGDFDRMNSVTGQRKQASCQVPTYVPEERLPAIHDRQIARSAESSGHCHWRERGCYVWYPPGKHSLLLSPTQSWSLSDVFETLDRGAMSKSFPYLMLHAESESIKTETTTAESANLRSIRAIHSLSVLHQTVCQ